MPHTSVIQMSKVCMLLFKKVLVISSIHQLCSSAVMPAFSSKKKPPVWTWKGKSKGQEWDAHKKWPEDYARDQHGEGSQYAFRMTWVRVLRPRKTCDVHQL